jgi:hypothetical protein
VGIVERAAIFSMDDFGGASGIYIPQILRFSEEF